MILVTGGAGFIGSNLLAALEQRGHSNLAVCDRLGHGDKWRNIAKREIAQFVPPEDLAGFLSHQQGAIDAVLHLGAISATTETDADLIVRTNLILSLALWDWCAETQVPFIYASSAATYGDGAAGFDDDGSCAALARLRPLNAYGWSKHAFDRIVARHVAEDRPRPPQWAGLKFFNVYGPNEYHKGDMISVVRRVHSQIRDTGRCTLFKSHREGIADGGQRRDFVAVDDCVAAMLWLLDNPDVCGLFNLGTGTDRSFAELAEAVFAAIGEPVRIDYVDMPLPIRDRYQYFTKAAMDRLRGAGYQRAFTSLEDGVKAYVCGHLEADDPYR
ncbi:MAG: ADP-glyceromanno-heptose 6-epimerase [Alphaproteobacteria bacterium]